MAELTQAFAVTETVGTTEWSFTTDSAGPDEQTTPGRFKGLFDVSALAAGDEFRFRVYEKVNSGGTQRVLHEATLIGAQAIPIYETPEFLLMHGWDMTWDKIAGTDRSIVGSIRQETQAATSDIAAIKERTDNLPDDPADASDLAALLIVLQADTDDIQARLPAALVGGRMASNAEVVGDKTGYALSSSGITAIWAEVMEGAVTAVQMMRGFAAVLLGKASGLETTNAKYRDLADTKDRIDATVDADGNRTAVTRDLT